MSSRTRIALIVALSIAIGLPLMALIGFIGYASFGVNGESEQTVQLR